MSYDHIEDAMDALQKAEEAGFNFIFVAGRSGDCRAWTCTSVDNLQQLRWHQRRLQELITRLEQQLS